MASDPASRPPFEDRLLAAKIFCMNTPISFTIPYYAERPKLMHIILRRRRREAREDEFVYPMIRYYMRKKRR